MYGLAQMLKLTLRSKRLVPNGHMAWHAIALATLDSAKSPKDMLCICTARDSVIVSVLAMTFASWGCVISMSREPHYFILSCN